MESSNLSVTCNECGKIFNNKNPKTSLFKHKIWCDGKKNFLEKYSLNKEILKEEYEKLGSVLSFKNKYPFWIGFNTYYRLFRDMEVVVSIKQSSNNQKTKLKRKKYNTEKYGCEHNFCRDHPSRKEWEKKMFNEEGITNVFQRESVKQKSIETIIKRYGTELYTMHNGTVRGMNIISKVNKKVFDILSSAEIEFEIELKIKKPKGYYYSYDVLISNTNKIIEINGDYWHGNPKIYKPNDIILKKTSCEILVKDKWMKDKKKIKLAKNNGYEVMIVWEYDLKNNFEKTVNKIIQYATSKN